MRRPLYLITLLLVAAAVSGYVLQSRPKPPIVLVVHGGAGTITRENMTPEKEEAIRGKLAEAIEEGYRVLEENGSSLDAVETAIRILEDSPLFNAGKGAVFTHDLTQELDASIMDGRTLNAGAVAGTKTVKNPIVAARMVMTNSKHVMLSGEGADIFAREQGLEIVEPAYFQTEQRRNQIQKVLDREARPKNQGPLKENAPTKKNKAPKDRRGELAPPYKDWKYGTVGCVALDREGNIVAGTSTGGMTNKQYGRIGDSPVIGAGTYANNNTCGVSCTGHGEYFIRYAVAHDLSAMLEYSGASLSEAAYTIIQTKLKNADGSGGLIAIDHEGNVVMEFNTRGMYRGFKREGESTYVGIYKEE